MGMYTELYIACEMKPDLPKDVEEVLLYLFGDGDKPETLPDHEFFKTFRWSLIGTGSSYYFIPFAVSNIQMAGFTEPSYYITSRSDIKNYEKEIQKFLDWLRPYIRGSSCDHIGHIRFEEDLTPTLLYKEE